MKTYLFKAIRGNSFRTPSRWIGLPIIGAPLNQMKIFIYIKNLEELFFIYYGIGGVGKSPRCCSGVCRNLNNEWFNCRGNPNVDDEIVAIGLATVTDDDVDVVVVDDVVAAVAAEVVAGVVVVLSVVVTAVIVGVGIIVVFELLFVFIDLIAEFEFVGGAAGLNGVFCFCILYIRLGHNVTRISRPNNSFPIKFLIKNKTKNKNKCIYHWNN